MTTNELDLDNYILSENYSFEDLLATTRERKLTIKELLQCLTKHQQKLNQTSNELFDSSYDKFYELSHSISCLSEHMQYLYKSVDSFRNELREICINRKRYIEEIDHKLQTLQTTTKNKSDAERLIHLIRLRDRIDKQVDKVNWDSILPPDRASRLQYMQSINYRTKCDLVERLAIELKYLEKALKYVKPDNDELLSIKKSLESNLEHTKVKVESARRPE